MTPVGLTCHNWRRWIRARTGMWAALPNSPSPDGLVRVTYHGNERRLARGEALTFGRGGDCAIRLPNDSHISRTAGSITVLEDCILIRNHSTTKPFVLRPVVGEDHVIEPGGAGTPPPHRQLQIVIVGMAGPPVLLALALAGWAATATTPVAPRPAA